ncbi:MAG: hypothetical protein AB1679_08705 [Actinomycetota bacterium]|jgi:hypothetical protein
MTDDASTGNVGGAIGRPPPVIRGACLLLLVTGFASVIFSAPVVLNPAAARCHLSRTWIEQVNDDKKDWNNVDLAGRKADDVPCEEAIPLADGIRTKEKDPAKTATVPGESALRIQNVVAVLLGLGQATAGFFVLRTLSRQARNMALGFSGASIILQVLGIISLGVFAFVVYAFAFSPASRELWPKQPRPTSGPPAE